ncbi:SDR family oxidoreductase [Vibrio fujianensis]|uniref:SDR family oxidoreductase n=1 Tax=Vibrio fujianensis TaxID=1974215 RepID=UPI000C16FC21|nr:SDR family oxidoreductase [Vibrio fujianensis]
MEINKALVVITSASSLFGCTLATHFTRLGANVIICDTQHSKLIESWKNCQRLSGNIDYYALNDHSFVSIDLLFSYIVQQFNKAPDVLINHWPALPFPSLIDDKTNQHFIEQMGDITSSLFTFGQACTIRMREHQTKGVIVNVISYPECDEKSGIDTARSLVAGLTQTWGKELTPFNIRVGGVVPMSDKHTSDSHWAEVQDELIRNTEYIVANDYFSGRIISA